MGAPLLLQLDGDREKVEGPRALFVFQRGILWKASAGQPRAGVFSISTK